MRFVQQKVVLIIVIFRAYSNQVMHYRLGVSADVLLPRFLFHFKENTRKIQNSCRQKFDQSDNFANQKAGRSKTG